MKIILFNGSPRKSGATASILNEMYQRLQAYPDVEVQLYHAADLHLNFCIGCCTCYRNGRCVFHDDLEMLSEQIETADGIILGSPTYAGNVSGQMKVLIDRGHFVMEQLLYRKRAVSVSTYENHGGRGALKILNRLLVHSGAVISGSLSVKVPFSANPFVSPKTQHQVSKAVEVLYHDIQKQNVNLYRKIQHHVMFRFGILPFVRKKGAAYLGVTSRWQKKGLI